MRDELAEFRKYRQRIDRDGLSEVDAWREVFERGYALGVRAAAKECSGECLNPLRLRFDYLVRDRG